MDKEKQVDAVEEEEEVLEDESLDDVDDEEPSQDEDHETNVESVARERGWMPKEDFERKFGKNPNKRYYSAEAFLDRGELFGAMEAKNRIITSLENRVNMMSDAVSKVTTQTYDKTRKDLITDRNSALEEGEATKANEIDERLEELAKDHHTPVDTPTEDAEDPAYGPWIKENQWFITNPVMQAEARMFYNGLLRNRVPFNNSEELFEAITTRMKRLYPEEFTVNTPAERPDPPVLGKVRASRPKGDSKTISDVPEELKSDYKRYKAQGMKDKDIFSDWEHVGLIDKDGSFVL